MILTSSGATPATKSVHTCEACGARVKVENLESHRNRVHPRIQFRTPVPANALASPRSRSPPPRRSLRVVVLLLAIVLVGSSAGYLILREAERGRLQDSGAVRVDVSMSGFTPNALSAREGIPLRIDLVNNDNSMHTDGGGRHNFVMPDLGVNILVEPESQAVFSLPTGSSGTYTWYCDICCGGKDNPAMLGTLTVMA